MMLFDFDEHHCAHFGSNVIQIVQYDHCYCYGSTKFMTSFGVPQGSILGLKNTINGN